jgi:thiamine monophosphate synthase
MYKAPNVIPFRRIAITPSDVINSEITFNTWFTGALNRGADAIMLRPDSNTIEAGFLEFCKQLVTPIPLLLNASLWPDNKMVSIVDGIHLKGNALWVLPSCAQLFEGCIGRSCHSLEECLRAQIEGYDYVMLSPVFRTVTHPEISPLLLDSASAIIQQLNIPVIGLGGIVATNEKDIRACGTHGVAAIGWFSE